MSDTQPVETDISLSVATALDQAIALVGNVEAVKAPATVTLAAAGQAMAVAFRTYGDRFPAGVDEDITDLEARLTHFEWAERAKRFLLLYRDVQLQLQKASLLELDGAATPAARQDLHLRSRQILAEARVDWEAVIDKKRNRLSQYDKARKQALREWKMLHNPWGAYRNQLVEIGEQCHALGQEYTVLAQQQGQMRELRGILTGSITEANDSLSSSLARAEDVVHFISETAEREAEARPGRIAGKLDDKVAGVEPSKQLHDFTNALNARIKELVEQIRVSVSSEQGLLQFKDINLQRATDQWIAAEVLPQLYELWELSEQATGGFGVAVSNVRNRSLLLANEIKEGKPIDYELEDLSQPLYDFLARMKTTAAAFGPQMEKLQELIEKDLRLVSVYRPEPGFLPLPLQAGINEFTRRQGEWLAPVRDWFNATFLGIKQWRGDAVREDLMSISEKVVRVITQRKPDPANEAYTNILLTKGYIGESFLVGRQEETAHLRRLIDNWRNGYRGAVALTGRRLSGRSLFGEMIANRLFPNNVIRLAPHSLISVEGRRMTTTGNLAEALAFIQKHSLRNQPMVWIDDLELWWDKDCSLSDNIRALSNHIDNFSHKIFYLVATTNAVYAHLNRFRKLDRIFQAEVNLDRFSVSNLQQALRIRHGATHQLLVEADGEPITQAAFDKRVAAIHRTTAGNVGDSLYRWAYQVNYCEEGRVVFSPDRRYRLPAFINADTGVLLAMIFLERRTNDYHLRRVFGPAYDRRYRGVLQRLLRVGILVRSRDGWLSICESVVTDVGQALENSGYLNVNKA